MSTERLITPATIMTAARPVLAGLAAWKLMHAETGVVLLMAGMALTDMEGKLAGAIDRLWPGSGYGRTEFGAALDPIADSLAFALVAAGALVSPGVSGAGKAAVVIVIISESIKVVWAVKANMKYKRETGRRLVIASSWTGKWATTFKFASLGAAILTCGLGLGSKRSLLGAAAVDMAIVGVILGEQARRGYKRQLASH